MRRRGSLGLVAALVAGAVAGLGAYTFVYGRGYSYLLDDPAACVNCHVMRDNFDAWAAAPHRTVTCNECHVPKAVVPKYASKLRNGWFHSYAFTFEDVQVIRIKPANQQIVQANCESCHARMIIHVQPPGAARARWCFDCHRGVAHGF
ncbi:MAG: cytochrome c nitrite reductase small subunit [Armatimonadota bacterium]|nr:cytochrome c nitrite reductase small subunit [Armatimonadota bacterium]MDR7422631.1 cytochrome c nitrite reductase small subunit [Armatimonadota bacterium]MDR7455267.1 cytochrome c nitrite reductase small subunit [Armatimonadota bacterium]MDR7457371.1 cytochrome c nitrite reductase small subunit [Armatimonadota bacterium]MDR7496752.1 cytochrome c nitrite reductase small subunit [Armatimonadota bacterium]